MTAENDSSLAFPEGFLWGAATSSHQVEGGSVFNDWWQWEKAGRVKEVSGDACRHFELFRQDFDIAQSLHHNAHRFSIEWSRVEPEPGRWNESAIQHYREVLTALREHRLEPIVTLHHFTNPLWFAKLGGWKSHESIYHFERFVNKMVKSLGDQVRFWLTINEPLVFIYMGYMIGEWPPGDRSPESALEVFKNFFLAHQRAYEVIHRVYAKQWKTKPMVSFAQHVAYHTPCSPWSLWDRFSAYVRHVFFTRLPFEALIQGHLFFPGLFNEKLPLKNTLDFIGINYYTRDFVHFADLRFPGIFGEVCSLIHHRDVADRNDMGWECYPEGLYRTLLEVKRFHLPVMITENGTCSSDDQDRWNYIRLHLESVRKAISQDVSVIGYLYWSLLDNFEWAHGFQPRFGLVEVDYARQSRKIRESAKKFSQVCLKNSLDT